MLYTGATTVLNVECGHYKSNGVSTEKMVQNLSLSTIKNVGHAEHFQIVGRTSFPWLDSLNHMLVFLIIKTVVL